MTPLVRVVSTWLFGEEGDTLGETGVVAMVVASAVLITGSILISPLIADLGEVYSVSEARAGLFMIVYTAAIAVALPVTGVIADRTGRKPVIVAGLVLFGLGGAAAGTTETFALALVFRGVQGVGFAAALPNVVAAFGDLYTGPRETTVQAIRMGANSVSNVSAPVLAGFLFVTSWRYPFALYLLALPIAAWIWLTLPSIKVGERMGFRRYALELTTFLRNTRVVLVLLAFFVRFVLFFGMLTYISVLAVTEAGMAVALVGALVSARGFALFLTSTQAGRLVTRFDPALLVAGGFLTVGFAIALMGAVAIPAVLVAGVFLQGIGDGLIAPTQLSLVNRIAPPRYRGATMSAAFTCQSVGMVLGPAALGVLLGFVGAANAFVLLGSIGGVTGACLLLGVWFAQR